MMPGIGNLIPMALLFGLGALMVPALGLGLLLREGKRRYLNVDAWPNFRPAATVVPFVNAEHPYYYRSFASINTSAIMEGISDVFERVMKALDNAEKKYD